MTLSAKTITLRFEAKNTLLNIICLLSLKPPFWGYKLNASFRSIYSTHLSFVAGAVRIYGRASDATAVAFSFDNSFCRKTECPIWKSSSVGYRLVIAEAGRRKSK
jgi:hypothetical protein